MYPILFVEYVRLWWPGMSPLERWLLALGFIWGLTLLNVAGVKLVGSADQQQYIPLTIREDSSTAAYVIQNSVTTWQAYNLWGGYSLYFGKTSGVAWAQGDFDYNGNVNVADLGDLSGNFGQSLSGSTIATAMSAPSTTSAVPEPAELAPITLALMAGLGRRRRGTV